MHLGTNSAKYFIWTENNQKKPEKLVFFDQNGNYFEKPIPQGATDQLLAIFNGLPKSVERSSGGLTLVTPTQIVVFNKKLEVPLIQPEIRVKVSFRDLERDSHHRITSKKVITKKKIVTLHELKEPFAYESQGSHNFVVDFGLGIVPVHVFSFRYDTEGVIWAQFVRHDELEAALLPSILNSKEISVYEVPRDILRILSPASSSNPKDFQWAKNHAKTLLERGEALVPEVLKTGASVGLPSPVTLKEIEEALNKAVAANSNSISATPSNSFELPESVLPEDPDAFEELIPFGELED
ncbi:MAG: hypothetical protein EBQ85_01860 [Proteobacteria bacterium]|nr:hypothetical protein [Pseudomonadota bacterium]